MRLAAVTDGTSNTAFFSEKIRGTASGRIPKTDMLVFTNQTSVDATYLACQALSPMTAPPLTSRQGMSWVMGEMCCTPVQPRGAAEHDDLRGARLPGTHGEHGRCRSPRRATIPGGATLMMGDGSVHFIKNSVSVPTWRRLGTRNNGEVVSADSY